MKGKIVAVCTSPVAGCPKFVQMGGEIAQFGIKGDFHCKPMRRNFYVPGTEVANVDRHITIVAQEVLNFANQTLGTDLKAGDLAENILVSGLGDLGDVVPGSLVRIGQKILLRVTGQNDPCKKLRVYHADMVKVLVGKRGLLCIVLKGVGQKIIAGDTVEIVPPK